MGITSHTQNPKDISSNISVIIPLYNKLDYIARCIDSVLRQTTMPGEIIVVDDGSCDGSADFVEQNYKNRVKLIKQSNGGESVARNTGIDNAKLEFIALLDGDDEWCPTFLEEICLLISENPDCDIFATAYKLVYPNQQKDPEYSGIKKEFRGKVTNYFKSSMSDWSVLSSSSTVLRRSRIIDVGKYKPGLSLGADTDLWCRLALVSNIAFFNKPLALYYCFNESSVTTSNIPSEELEYSKKLTTALSNKKVPQEMQKDVKKYIAKGLQYLIREHAKRGNYSILMKFLLDKRVYYYFGFSSLKMLLAIIAPRRTYEYIKNTRTS